MQRIPSLDGLRRIAKVPKREFMRRGVNQHTLEKICRGESVRAIKLAHCLKVLEEYERGQMSVMAINSDPPDAEHRLSTAPVDHRHPIDVCLSEPHLTTRE